MLIVLHLGHWLLWVGVKRAFPWPVDWGRDVESDITFGLTFEIV